MKRFNSFHSINVFAMELAQWDFELHNHNFYELIFIEKGTGTHTINELAYPYKASDIFLLTPNDSHGFNIKTKTRFIYLKFTEQVFLEKLNTKRKSRWEQALKNVLLQFVNTEGSIVRHSADTEHLFMLVKIMLHEFTGKAPFNDEVVLELFGSVMAIIARALNQNGKMPQAMGREIERINEILSYTRIHAVDNDKMDIKNMAAHFTMSPNYISTFVKKHSGLSIQQHIIQAKVKAAEKLLKQNRYTVNEIADRLGFTDASHFSKIFKKYKNTTPGSFSG